MYVPGYIFEGTACFTKGGWFELTLGADNQLLLRTDKCKEYFVGQVLEWDEDKDTAVIRLFDRDFTISTVMPQRYCDYYTSLNTTRQFVDDMSKKSTAKNAFEKACESIKNELTYDEYMDEIERKCNAFIKENNKEINI